MKKKYVNFLLCMAGAIMVACGGGDTYVKAEGFESAEMESEFKADMDSESGFSSEIEQVPGADKAENSFFDFEDSPQMEGNRLLQNQEAETANDSQKPAEEVKAPLFNMDMDATEIKYWKQDGNNWYCVGLDGQFLTGWVKIKNSIYYFDESGLMQTGWLEVDKRCYFMDATGRLQVGWKEVDGKWFYLNNEYGKLIGHVSLNGYMYYFDIENGMQTGWQEIDGSWFYFRESGRQNDGWFIDGEKWYYLEPEMGRCTGQHEIDGEGYFFDEEGVMQTGWQLADGKLFYYQEKGQMLTDVYMRYVDGRLYYLSEQGAEEDNSIIGNYEAVYDVTAEVFGADGSDSNTDTKAIQKALDLALKMKSTDGSQILVRIPAGTYYIDDMLMISSNTALELEPEARIVRTNLSKVMLTGAHINSQGQYCWGESCKHGGYSQLKNVSISGGVWDGNVGSRTNVATSSIITFAHGIDICVKDTTIKNGSGYHLLVLDGIADSRIENVIFREQLSYTGREDYTYFDGESTEIFNRINEFTEEEWQQLWKFKEALHIDFTNPEGSSSYPFDDTACQNIVITGCDFEDVLAGVGSHHSIGSKKHTGISIEQNSFENLRGNGIGSIAMENLLVKNNSIDGANIGLYATENSHNITVSSNSIKNTTANGITIEYSDGIITDNNISVSNGENLGIRVKENTNETTLSGNTIIGGFNGISGGNTKNLKVRGNTISNCKNSGISISDSDDIVVENNTVTDSESGIDIGFWNCTSGSCTGNVITSCMADNIKSDENNVSIKDNSAQNPLNGWISINGYWYYYNDGTMQTGWQKINGKWYYMRPSGRMHIGWLQDGKDWFYLTKSGKMQYGWCEINNNRYYFNPIGGRMLTGWKKIDGSWYYLNTAGKLQTGWLQNGNKWYYLTESGKMQIGWYRMNGYWYYFDPSGAMKTGWQDINKKRYYFRESGRMQTGWFKDKDNWYFLTASGAAQTGWHCIEGEWLYFTSTGVMQTGWQDINKKRYYFRESGRMQTGWFEDKDNWYFLTASGAMQIGWCSMGEEWLYFDSDGVMQTGWQDINKNRYYFRESGRMHTEWLQLGNDWYYFNGSGKMQTGWQQIGKFKYYFESDGKMVSGNKVIDGIAYTFGKNGKLIENI